MTPSPVISRIIMADGKPFALLEDNRLVPVTEMYAVNMRLTRTPAKAVSGVAGPLPPLGPTDPTAGKWLAFPMPDPVALH